ncbi:hypothetical protein ABEY41_26875 [Peribacillus butanolivorans]|uniref:hypothetical protein n=1 Tax=Peribacillus butanolivorans TaxID=421767 RepID=UPI003D2CD7C1
MNKDYYHLRIIKIVNKKQIPDDSIRHDGQISKSIYVSASTYDNIGKIRFATVVGVIEEDNLNVFTASINLFRLTDYSLSVENKE